MDKRPVRPESWLSRFNDLQNETTTFKSPPINLRRHLRGYFLAGIIVTAPISITLYMAWVVIEWIDEKVTSILPPFYNPETYLPFGIPGLGLLVVSIALIFIGALTAGIVGRFWLRVSELLVDRMPVIRSVYGAIKPIFETLLSNQSDSFREVVLFEYPRRGSWAMGFITSKTQGEVQNSTEDEVVNVFVPTTPNPTSGYLLFIPKREMVVLSMTVEDGIKMVVSGGIVTPQDSRPDKMKVTAKVAAASGDKATIYRATPPSRVID